MLRPPTCSSSRLGSAQQYQLSESRGPGVAATGSGGACPAAERATDRIPVRAFANTFEAEAQRLGLWRWIVACMR